MKQNYKKSIIEWLFHKYFPEKEIITYSLCEGGIENSNFLIETAHAKYILKVFEGFKNHNDMIHAEVGILVELKKIWSNVPEIFVTWDGQNIILGPEGKEVILMEYIEGVKHRDEPLNSRMLFSLWSCIASFNHDISKFNGAYPVPETHMYDLKYIFRHPELQIYKPDYVDPYLLKEVWMDIEEVRSVFESLPVQIIHNDLHSNNIIFKNNEPYFIDFSDFLLSPVIQEIATSLVSWCFHHFWYPEGMAEYLCWYESIRKLTMEEKKCLYACVECRMLNIILAPYIPESGIDMSNNNEMLVEYSWALKRLHEFWKENFIKYVP